MDAPRVVAAAARVYGRTGVAGLTMRAVAAELGVAPNALYSHVKNKEALVDAVIDTLLGEVQVTGQTMKWRDGLLSLMSASRVVLLRYSDLMPQFLSRPTRGPNALRLGEATLGFLAGAGLTGASAAAALRILLVYTIGFAAQEAPRRADPAGVSRRKETQRVLRAANAYPRMRAQAGVRREPSDEEVFIRGLGWLLDSVAREKERE
jgi:TetR/AcrR family tetracycline transcriptional repressor